MATETLVAKATILRKLKDVKAEMEGKLKIINGQIKELVEHDLPKLMDDQEITKFTVEGVGTIFLQTGIWAYIRVDDQDDAYAWLKENGHGDLIKDTIHWKTLNGFAKEQMEEGKGLPDFFNSKPVTKAALRRN